MIAPRSACLRAPASAATAPLTSARGPGATIPWTSSRGRSRCSPARLEPLAGALARGLRRELHLTPKPGLVDLEDSGSHPDLSLALMERSVAVVAEYLRAVSASLGRGEPLARQIALGRAAEHAMLSRLGTNTHRGAVFLCGLVLVAAHRAGVDDEPALRAALSSVAGEVAALSPPRSTNGAAARARFGVGGVVREARAGLPSVFEVAVPAFRGAVARGEGAAVAGFRALAALMQTVEDTTALHRCGRAGLARLQVDGAQLDRLLPRVDYVPFLRERNAAYRRWNLTMGGVADLLGIAFAWLDHAGDLAP